MYKRDRIDILGDVVVTHRELIDINADLIQELESQLGIIDRTQDLLCYKSAELESFKKRIESYPKTFILPCKKCGHHTLQYTETTGDNYCLNCGTTWRKRIRETVEEVK
jgi:ribosomal protein S27E